MREGAITSWRSMRIYFVLEFTAGGYGETWYLRQFLCKDFLFTESRTLNSLNVLSHIAHSSFKSNSTFILQVSEGNVPKNIHSVFHKTNLTKFCLKSQMCSCHPNFELLKGACSPLCLCIASYLSCRTLQQIISKKRDSRALLLVQVKPKYSNFGLYYKRMKWWNRRNLKLLYSKCEEEGNAKINRMWNRILQSITTFLSAGGGVVEQMCWDLCRERRKNPEKHKRKACPTKDIFREDGLRRTLLCHSKYPVKQSLGHYLLMFFALAQGTQYLRNVTTEGILSCVSSLSTKQNEK